MQPLEADDPQSVGEYRLLRRLGAGGMGRVYLGRSPGGRTVAVKVVHPHFAADGDFRRRFRREVESARRVGGAWTAPVLGADPEAATPWVATGYVAGPSLQQAVTGHGPMPEHTVRALGAGLAEALAAVHGLALVHRDVKPSNILLTLDGPRLIDFGIARATDGTTSLTSTGATVGSPGYMSPEQVLGGDVGPATDVFSLGAVLAFAATGTPPFPGDNQAALLYRVVHGEPELDGLDGELREIAEACLAKDPGVRPAPAEIARRLAGPAGAAGLVRGGWLPGPVVEGVSRRAVELLELEVDHGTHPEPGTAPLIGRTAGPSGGPGGSPGGVFGPPPDYTRPSGGTHGGGPHGEDGEGAPAARRRSRTAVLAAVAVPVAAATGALLLWLSPFSEFSDGNGGPRSGGDPTGSPTASAAGAASGDVPEAFLGRWKGSTTTSSGLPSSMDITVREGRVGEVVARDHSVLPLGGIDCSGDYVLVSATEEEIVLDSSGGENPHPGICSDGSDREEFTLNEDGTLHYRSGDGPAGRPSGDLRRQD